MRKAACTSAVGGKAIYQTLYRKYRPQRFTEVVGQRHVTVTLQNSIASGKLAHAYLFCGPRGTGKTTTARILAKALNCTERGDSTEPCGQCTNCRDIGRGVSFDVYEVDAASHRGIDDIRQISERAQQAATDPSRYRVFIIDEVHQLSRDGASAFLKTLEEPPPNVVFVLATTDADKMIPTILSRCQRFDFHPVQSAELVGRLKEVCAGEGIDADPDALEAIARRSRGGVRDALSALEQARALAGDHVRSGDVVQLFGGLDAEDLAAVVDALVAQDTGAVLQTIDDLVARGIDVRVLSKELADHLRSVFLVAAAPGAGFPATERIGNQARAWGPARSTRALQVLGEALVRMPQSLNPRIDLEAALVSIAHPELDTSPGAVAARLERLDRSVATAQAPARPAPQAPASPEAPPAPAEPALPPIERTAPHTPHTPPVRPVGDGGSLDHIAQGWPGVMEALKGHSRKLQAYYVDSEPVALDGDVLTVRFSHQFNRDRACQADTRQAFTAVAQEVLGRALQLDGVVGEARTRSSNSSARRAAPAGRPGAARTPADLVPADDIPAELAGDPDSVFDVTAGSHPSGNDSVLDLLLTELRGEVVDERETE